MEKMNLVTKNLTDENIQRILELFPNVATEKEDENGKLKTAIDFDKLKQELSEVVVDGEESYDFTWVGKKEAMIEANRPIRKTLRPDKESSVNWDTTENIYIEGDNLDALKLLQESYMGKVKMIYIDPPYNTGKDFVYRDNFTQDKDSYEEEIGAKDEEGNRLFQNTESNGRFHSDWCSMIYSRLKLARNLLSDDGVIFISIDDNELINLKKICDEVFSEENFVNNISVKMSELSGVKMKHLNKYAKLKETVLVYSKNHYCLNLSIEKKKKNPETLASYLKYYSQIITNMEDDCTKWIIVPISQYLKNYNTMSEAEINNFKIQNSEKMVYRTNSKTVDSYLKTHPDASSILKIKNADGNDIVKWDNKEMLFLNKYIEEYIGDIWMDISTINLNKETESIVFENGQKPLSLIKRVIKSLSDKSITVLDFFSGSATTAHAVMQLNAEDGGNRKFIMVQLPEQTNGKSEAYKAGYKNICEIGKERIRRAGKKIQEENPDKTLDIGFRVFKVDDTNMKDVYYTPNEYSQNLLSSLESNIKDDRTDEDLLYGCLLDWGVELSLPHRIEMIDGKRIHIVNEDDLIACFEENISETVVKEIAKKQPTRVVFRDSSFNSDDNRINVEEIFKLQSPNTRVKVI